MGVVVAQERTRAASMSTPAAARPPAAPEYDPDLHVTALDLLSGLAEGLGASLDALVGEAQRGDVHQVLLSAVSPFCYTTLLLY